MKPLFSLILPCYNVEAYVARCVHSILVQDCKDYEIILVDDGARDGTPAICDQLAAAHACIRVIHKENGGLASARNAGLDVARGQYVWFIDSDDWINPGALEKLCQACQSGDPDIVKFDYLRVSTALKQVSGIIPAGRYAGEEEIAPLRRNALCQAGKYSLSACFHVYRRKFLEEHELHFASERIVCSEDYLFNLQALMHVERMQVLHEALYSYELRPGSLTQTYKPDLPERYGELHRQLTDYIRLLGKEREYGPLIDRFYVWHLAAGTCIPHEYHAEQPRAEARKHVCWLLKSPALRMAVRCSDRTGLPGRKRVQLLAMRAGFEPLFYYLHVVKPQKAGVKRAEGMMK